MRNFLFYASFFIASISYSQLSDFNQIDFSKADAIAKTVKSKRLYDLNKLSYSLTKDLETDVEKLKAIYTWICTNVANDFRLYSLNERKRRKFEKDSIQLETWNSEFKQLLFKKLLKKKRTICTGYAYLLHEMCSIVGIESKMVNGFGKTATTDFSELSMPNHTWNVVKLNNKWYVCDPTWSTGISFPEDGKFKFDYNEGYFLTHPKLFSMNHFPLESEFSLLGNTAPYFKEFVESPLLYGDAYRLLNRHIAPKKMHHKLYKNDTLTFQYALKSPINPEKIRFVAFSGSTERNLKPEVTYSNNILTLTKSFRARGYYDLHLYIENKLIATYTLEVLKRNKQ